MVDIESALEQCEKLGKELHSINEWDTENIDDIQEAVWGCKGEADILVTQLSELQEDIGDAMYRLNDIIQSR